MPREGVSITAESTTSEIFFIAHSLFPATRAGLFHARGFGEAYRIAPRPLPEAYTENNAGAMLRTSTSSTLARRAEVVAEDLVPILAVLPCFHDGANETRVMGKNFIHGLRDYTDSELSPALPCAESACQAF